MAYLVAADFRDDSLNEVCADLALGEEIEDAELNAGITRLAARLETWCNDTFISATGAVTVDGKGGSRLLLPQRYTAVTAVSTVDEFGTVSTALNAAAYRLHSSLNATGSERINTDTLDWLALVPGGYGLTAPTYGGSAYGWPLGTGTVRVTGTYGWTTTPADINRALALMVYDHFKTKRADLRLAEQVSGGDVIVRYPTPDTAAGIWTGIHDVDLIIGEYRRVLRVGVS